MNTHCCSTSRSRGKLPYRRPLGASLRLRFAVALNRLRRRISPRRLPAQPQLLNTYLS